MKIFKQLIQTNYIMRKVTLLLSIFCISVGYSQMPTTAAPTPPVRNATDVISIYGSAYTPITGVTTNPNWSQTTVATEVQIAGNATLQYANFNYQGTDWAGNIQNISGFQYLHVDIWTNNQSPNVYAISSGTEVPHAISSVAGSWQSLDIPVAGLTGNLNTVIQFKFDGGTGGTIYLDNLYFWKSPPAIGTDATLSDLKVDGTTIPGFNSSAISYAYNLIVGTTAIPQITATPNDPLVTSVTITQAPALPGNATVVVVSQNGTVTKTYTVSFAAILPNSSPTPTTSTSEVLSIYGDTGGFTNVWMPDYNFGSNEGYPDLDPSSAVNQAVKMNFATAGYGQGTNGVTDISAYNWLHFDYFADATSTQIRFIVIGNNGSVVEYPYELTNTGSNGTLVHGSWQSVDVPLSFFQGSGFTKSTFFQYKLGTTSNLVSNIVYFDNIYFSMNKGTVLSTTGFDRGSVVSVYPNPSQNEWNIEATHPLQSVQLFDILGKKVTAAIVVNGAKVTIQASDLSKGIYFANLITEMGNSSVKLSKD